jgi:rhodanese-related sulfurtransferase
MTRRISLVVPLVLVISFYANWLAAQNQTPLQPERIAVSDLKRKLDSGEKFLLIDVREASEIDQEGAIPGAIHIPVGQLDARMKDIPKDVEIVFYCASGRRASAAAEKFIKAGYKAGPFCGIADWKKDNQPVVDKAEPPAAGPIRPQP